MDGSNAAGLGFEDLIVNEWLATNKLGSYACSTAAGANTRKYHGLLVAAMTPPVRRMVLLSRVEETVVSDGWPTALACNEYPGTVHPHGFESLAAFSPRPFPRWAYQGDGWTIEKSVRLLKNENTVVLTYTLLGGDKPIELQARPMFALRGIHELMYQWNGNLAAEKRGTTEWRIPPTTRTPEIFFSHDGTFGGEGLWYLNTIYRNEQERGYAGLEDLWSPGQVRWKLSPGQSAYFVCSTDPVDYERSVARADAQYAAPPESRTSVAGVAPEQQTLHDSMLRAADDYVAEIPPEGKDKHVQVMSLFPWSPPLTRHGLVGFSGLFLVTGKHHEGRLYLQNLLDHLDRGLIPSEFPETGDKPLYTAADASLWLINAAWNYFRYTNDDRTVRGWFDALWPLITRYRYGTALGLVADADGLLTTHEPGVPTTWMDATVNEWVITPRQGRPVELNALWYNALRVMSDLARRFDQHTRAEDAGLLATKVQQSFNKRFWNDQADCCLDVVEDHGFDASIRPNQILAVSLPFPVLDAPRHEPVLDAVAKNLLTPLGVRTLSPSDPNYHGRYGGGIIARDRAYHRGSAFPWLLGPMVTAYVRVHGRGAQARREAERLLQKPLAFFEQNGLRLPELFDGDAPHAPGGAPASALSLAEVLRAYTEDVLDQHPTQSSITATQPTNSHDNLLGDV
jgi:predicted glycogen debranching enzyme